MIVPTPKELKDEAGTAGELFRIAWPLVVSSGSLTLMHVVDRIFLAGWSTDSLAAALPAGALNWTLMSIAIGTAAYVNAFVAQYEGARRFQRVARVIWQGVWFSLVAGLLLLAVIPFSGWIFTQMGHSAELVALEARYFAILMAGVAPAALATTLSTFFSGRGRSLIVLYVNVFGTLVNAVLDYWFIFGGLGLPPMGIEGAAIATVLGSVAMAGFYIACIARMPEARRYRFREECRWDGVLFRRLLTYGLPNGLHMGADLVCFTLFIFVVGQLGRDPLAGASLAFNLNTLSYVPMMGLATAVMTLVGTRVGEERPRLAQRTVWIAFGASTGFMILCALLFCLAPDVILAPYAWAGSDLGSIHSLVVVLLRFVAFYCLFDAMALIFGAAIRGAGDTRFSLLYSLACGLFCMVLPTYFGVRYGGFGIVESFATGTVCVVVMGLGFFARFLGGRWLTMRVIEPDLVESEQAACGESASRQPASA